MKIVGSAVPWEKKHDPVSERAADFFERRRFAEWSDADQAEFDAWLAESTFHRVAYLRVEAAATYTDHLAAVHTFEVGAKSEQSGDKRARNILRREFLIPLLVAASVVLTANYGIPYINSLMQSPERTYSTEVGGRTLLNFADHTQIELNTDTAMRFRMTTTERTVWLDKGEAWFNVTHNAANPFTVYVGKHRITDLGTEFLVRRGAHATEVALLRGRAALAAEGAPTTVLVPGDDALATPVSMSVTRKSLQALSDELAWRRGMLVFRNAKLSDVVREFNRYNTTKLVIADPSIAGETISADAKTDDYEGFLQLAEVALKLRVDREGGVILISGRDQHGVARKSSRLHTRASAP